jgi:hypothetical protein
LLTNRQETGKGITTRDVKQEVDALLTSRQPPSPIPSSRTEGNDPLKRQSLDYKEKFKKYEEIIFLESTLGWPTTSRETVLRHLRKLLDKEKKSGTSYIKEDEE